MSKFAKLLVIAVIFVIVGGILLDCGAHTTGTLTAGTGVMLFLFAPFIIDMIKSFEK